MVRGSIPALAAALGGKAGREKADLAAEAEAAPVRSGTRGGSISLSVEVLSDVRTSDERARRETPEAWVVPVFYGTDRARTGKPAPQDFFGPGRGELSFGRVEVSLPKARAKGEMPTPSWWKPWQSKEDPSRFVLLLNVAPMERGPFVAELRQAVSGTGSRGLRRSFS